TSASSRNALRLRALAPLSGAVTALHSGSVPRRYTASAQRAGHGTNWMASATNTQNHQRARRGVRLTLGPRVAAALGTRRRATASRRRCARAQRSSARPSIPLAAPRTLGPGAYLPAFQGQEALEGEAPPAVAGVLEQRAAGLWTRGFARSHRATEVLREAYPQHGEGQPDSGVQQSSARPRQQAAALRLVQP